MHTGYIKLWRKIMQTAFYKKPNICHMAIHLLLKANHKPQSFVCNGKSEIINTGQILTGRKALANETGQSQQQVRTALLTLSDPTIGFLTIKTTNKFSLISIGKYGEYQELSTNNLTNKQPTTNQQLTTNKNDKNVKNDKDLLSAPDKPDAESEFNQFWKAYPYKAGKDKALEAWDKKHPPLDKCLSTLDWQIKSEQWTKEAGKFIPMPATWINQGRWKDEPLNADIKSTDMQPCELWDGKCQSSTGSCCKKGAIFLNGKCYLKGC